MGMQTDSTVVYGILFEVVWSRYENDKYAHVVEACNARGLEMVSGFDSYHDEYENAIIGITIDGKDRQEFNQIATEVESALDESFIKQLTGWFDEEPKDGGKIGVYSVADLNE